MNNPAALAGRQKDDYFLVWDGCEPGRVKRIIAGEKELQLQTDAAAYLGLGA